MTLKADPVPWPTLAYAAHTAGEIHIHGGKSLTIIGAPLSTNGELKNDGTVYGNVHVSAVDHLGDITGTKVLNAPQKPMPSPTIVDKYAALGTQITTPSTIQLATLTPATNPFGSLNSDGVYVIRPTGDLTIKNSRIHGTLVVICPSGKHVKIDDRVLIHPYRNDFPSLIIKGDAEFVYYSSLTTLSELLLLTNFNPAGSAYLGQQDSDLLDTYPSEIQGFVYVTGKTKLKQTARLRGALLVSSIANDAIDVDDSPEIIYTPSLMTNPPQWFTTEVKMPVQLGTWKQLTN